MCELLVVLIAICKYKKIKTRFLLAAFMLSVYLIVSSIKEMNILIIVKVIAGFCFIYFFVCSACAGGATRGGRTSFLLGRYAIGIVVAALAT